MNDWPKYYKNQLIINSDKGIAITCGWTKKEDIWNNLSSDSKEKVSVMGQLYSKEGINFIIRNTFLNPKINFLIVTGRDASGSIKSFNDFLFNQDNTFIHQEIPTDKVEEFRNYFSKNCAFIELSEIDNFIKKLEVKEHNWTKNILSFKDHTYTITSTFPSEKIGFRIEGKRIADIWIKVLDKINKFGFEKMSSYDEKQRELLDIITVIDGEDPDNPYIPDYFYFNKNDLINYYPQMMTDAVFPGVEYTYGSRLRNHEGINQIDLIVKELQREAFSRRAIAFTWNVEKDCKSSKSPCLDLVQALIQDNKIYLTAYFRSNDMFRAWPQNAFGLLKIQKEIAEKLNIGLGKLAIISSSAHIYERDFLEAQKVIENGKILFDKDPRGNFLIEIAEDQITVKHFDQEGKLLQDFKGKKANELKNQISQFISDIDHALYLGGELMRAEKAIKEKEDFIQDED
ncbi:MAG: thymidylate synthase [Candidatus Paceibacterota bacterium]|jgi:thymidylate synthase